jgi:hypothetical protein
MVAGPLRAIGSAGNAGNESSDDRRIVRRLTRGDLDLLEPVDSALSSRSMASIATPLARLA